MLFRQSLVLLSFSNSSCREYFNVVDWCGSWFPFLNEILWLDLLKVVEDKSRLLKKSWTEFWFRIMLAEFIYFKRSESLEVLFSLSIDKIIRVDSKSSPILFFIDIISTEYELGKESLVSLSSSNSLCRDHFDVVGWNLACFLCSH